MLPPSLYSNFFNSSKERKGQSSEVIKVKVTFKSITIGDRTRDPLIRSHRPRPLDHLFTTLCSNKIISRLRKLKEFVSRYSPFLVKHVLYIGRTQLCTLLVEHMTLVYCDNY